MALYSHIEGRRSGRPPPRDGARGFRARARRRRGRACASRPRRRGRSAPRRRRRTPRRCARRAGELRPGLWERRPGDEDFLALRLGAADLPVDVARRARRAAATTSCASARSQELDDRCATLPASPSSCRWRGARSGWPAAGRGRRPRPLAGRAGGGAPQPARSSRSRWRWRRARRRTGTGSSGCRTCGADDRSSRRRAGARRCSRARRRRRRRAGCRGRRRPAASTARCCRGPPREGGSVMWLGRGRARLPGACTPSSRSTATSRGCGSTDVRRGDGSSTTSRPTAIDARLAPRSSRGCSRPSRDAGAPASRGRASRRACRCSTCSSLPEPTPASGRGTLGGAAPSGLRAPIGVAADGPFEVDAGRTDGLRSCSRGMPGAGKSELLQTLDRGARGRATRPTRLTLPARRLQGRSGVRRLRRAAAHGRADHRPRRAPRRARARLAARRAAPPRGAARRARAPRSLRELAAPRPGRRAARAR